MSSIQAITELYAIIIAHREPAEPKKLFEDFKNTFIADIRNRFRSQPLVTDPNSKKDYVLTEILYKTRFQ